MLKRLGAVIRGKGFGVSAGKLKMSVFACSLLLVGATRSAVPESELLSEGWEPEVAGTVRKIDGEARREAMRGPCSSDDVGLLVAALAAADVALTVGGDNGDALATLLAALGLVSGEETTFASAKTNVQKFRTQAKKWLQKE
jgi:hypothetical protein